MWRRCLMRVQVCSFVDSLISEAQKEGGYLQLTFQTGLLFSLRLQVFNGDVQAVTPHAGWLTQRST